MSIKVKAEATSTGIITLMAWVALFSVLFTVSASAQPVTNSNLPDVTPVSKNYLQNLLEKYARQQKDFGSFLATQPGLTLAAGTIYTPQIGGLSKLPAPLDQSLQAAVDSFADAGHPSYPPPMRLLWLPMEKIGAVYFDEGSGACGPISFLGQTEKWRL